MMDNRKFRKKISTIYAEAVLSVGASNSGGKEYIEQLKTPNVLKQENHYFDKTVAINFKTIICYAFGR